MESQGSEFVIADMEAGSGSLTRMAEGSLDLAIVVTEPTSKSIEVARRAIEIIAERKISPVLVTANRVRDDADAAMIAAALGGVPVHPVPDDDAVRHADREGVSVYDSAPLAPAVRAIAELALRLGTEAGIEGVAETIPNQGEPRREQAGRRPG